MAFKIADGYVEVHGRLDEESFRRAAKHAGEKAGNDASDHFETAFSKSTRSESFSSDAFDGVEHSAERAGDRAGKKAADRAERSVRRGRGRMSSAFGELFRPNEGAMEGLLHPLESALSIPIVMALAAGIVTFGVEIIAAAISSAVLLGVGAAVVGGAAWLLADKLKTPFKKAMGTINKVMEQAAKPLMEPLKQAMRDTALLFKGMEGQFEAIFRASAPIIPLLVDTFGEFAKEILPTIGQIMPFIVDMFEALAQRSPEIADAISDLLKAMADEDTITAFNYLLTGLIAIIDFLGWTLGVFTRSFVNDIKTWRQAVLRGQQAIDALKDAIKSIPGKKITHYLFSPGAALLWISRVTGATKAIPKAWRTFMHFLGGGGAIGWALRVTGSIRRIPRYWKTLFRFVANSGPIRAIIGWIRRIPRNVTTTFTTVTRNIVQSIVGGFHNPFGGASGGIMGGGRGMAAGGLGGGRQVLVGEQGPELVNLPFGSKVTPAGQTRAALGRGGGGQVILEVHPGGGALDDLFFQWLRKGIRSRGGNVQVVLGR